MKKLLGMLFIVLMTVTSLSAGNLLQEVKVEYTEPIYKTFNQRVRIEDKCTQIMVTKNVSCGNEKQVNRNSIGLDTIFGATLGVIAGNQVGKGNGRTVAKVVGGLGGAYGANQLRGGNKTCKVQEPVQQCKAQYANQQEKRLTGYLNCGMYMKQKLCKKSNKEMKTFRIVVSLKVI